MPLDINQDVTSYENLVPITILSISVFDKSILIKFSPFKIDKFVFTLNL